LILDSYGQKTVLRVLMTQSGSHLEYKSVITIGNNFSAISKSS